MYIAWPSEKDDFPGDQEGSQVDDQMRDVDLWATSKLQSGPSWCDITKLSFSIIPLIFILFDAEITIFHSCEIDG